MTRYWMFLLSFCLGAGLATALAQRAQDGTEIAPDAHRVVLENDHVRVIEVRAAAGARSPMHSHQAGVIVQLGSARLADIRPDGGRAIVDRRPGEVLWSPGVEHAVEVLAGDLHVILIEVKSAQARRHAEQ